MKKGESRWCSNGHLAAFYFKYRAKVNLLTNADVLGVEKDKAGGYLPELVKIYRKHMGHVDKVMLFSQIVSSQIEIGNGQMLT